jgi:hypothetical protein
MDERSRVRKSWSGDAIGEDGVTHSITNALMRLKSEPP